ncbi:hypothetical protein ABES33_26445 [Bacillus pseudomycoides]
MVIRGDSTTKVVGFPLEFHLLDRFIGSVAKFFKLSYILEK